jgi:hypothetical protein
VQNRAIVHKEQERQSVAAFYNLSQIQRIKPAEPLIDAEYPLCWEKWYLVNTSRLLFQRTKLSTDGKKFIQ